VKLEVGESKEQLLGPCNFGYIQTRKLKFALDGFGNLASMYN
jgi:hypothetical protein